MTLETTQSTPAAAEVAGFIQPRRTRSQREASPTTDLGDVLFEQLRYLIRFADQERDRFERVRTILMETFN